MGIPGLANVIGAAERQSLSSFAVSHFEKQPKPLRIAIDISIWLFQLQASKTHGANPYRTLLYRLIRLCSLPIHALFVFDGPARPQYKRGKLIGDPHAGTFGALLKLAKKMLDAFQMPYHNAPGEAEAECALLQRSGIVDAVMTEDIDAIMFGSTVTVMNFTRENPGGTSAATHVTIYRMEDAPDGSTKKNVNMDRGGMILFALLSGGDYIPAGVPKCGRKVAREIVDAGFGAELLSIFEGDGKDIDVKLANWRERLQSELRDNSSGFFKNKHKAIIIPDIFPDRATVLDYITPVVSSPTTIDNLRYLFQWDSTIDVSALLQLVKEDLRWNETYAVVKLTSMLGPSLLTQRLLMGLPLIACFDADEETNSIRICNEKLSNNPKDANEVRVEYIPTKVVGLEVDAESIALPSSSQQQQQQQQPVDVENNPEILPDDTNEEEPSSQRPQTKVPFDPKQKQRAWLLEPIAKLGLSDEIKEWRAKQRPKREATEPKTSRSGVAGKKVLDPSMRHGEILRYGRIVNPNAISKLQENSSSSQTKSKETPTKPTSTMTTGDEGANSGEFDETNIISSQSSTNQQSLLGYNYRSVKPNAHPPHEQSEAAAKIKLKNRSPARQPNSSISKRASEATQHDDSINDDELEAALLEISESDAPTSQSQEPSTSAKPPPSSSRTAKPRSKTAKKPTTNKKSQKNTITAYTVKDDENANGITSDTDDFELPSLDNMLDKVKYYGKTASSRPQKSTESPALAQKDINSVDSNPQNSSRQSRHEGVKDRIVAGPGKRITRSQTTPPSASPRHSREKSATQVSVIDLT